MELSGTGIKLRQLQVFREVIRTGSERLASKLLGVTQPAISQNIRQLEEAVGFALFVREKGKMRPTDQAWELVRSVESAFTGLDRIRGEIEGIKSSDRRSLSIAAPGPFCLRLLPEVVKALRRERVFHRVRVRSANYQEIAEMVHDGRSDIAISRLPIDVRRFDYVPVAKAVNVCLFGKDHRFSKLDIVRVEDLVDEALVDIDPQFSAHQMNVNALRFMGNEPDIAVEYDAHGHDAGFVSAGIGVSITNSVIATEYRHFGLQTRLFEPGASYHYVVLWQRGRALNPSMQRAVQLISDCMQAEGRD
ncbi:LysR family transcriptional regulator [Neorhizobium sp. P12A]|uniref:LysR family transcriptional regulator n=1 Tax=Neorhizobium sp. P12A TaxID=2268027 RepID=UPI0011ECEE38|nr:LysR family transcriptional regulator [Neorhizobium sp. P12A]KAA0689456.1 LysR family transcriptional regulator [Neorhizobium sp. P12A]